LNNNYSYLFFDASFLSQLYRIDKSCELIEYFKLFANDANCVVDEHQYEHSPCNSFETQFVFLNHLISDEEILEKAISSENIDKDLEKIFRDPVDVKIFIWALSSNDILILTCDRNLLLLCKDYDIYHTCFKNAIKILDHWMNGAIEEDSTIKTELMLEGDDPFFHFNRNTRCVSHCGPSSICISYHVA